MSVIRECIEKFLDIYKNETCLWNAKIKDYHDKDKKETSYQKLVQKLKEIEPLATKDTVLKKINIYRSNYRKEVKKIKEALKSGEVYEPKLWYFRRLSFLSEARAEEKTTIEEKKEEGTHEFSPEIATDHKLSQILEEYEAEPLPRRKKRKHSSGSPLPSFISSAISRLEHVSAVQREETEFDVWAKSVALQLNRMDLGRALRLQLRLQSVIAEERIAYECDQ